jgi:hypothetical protein
MILARSTGVCGESGLARQYVASTEAGYSCCVEGASSAVPTNAGPPWAARAET